MTASSNQSGAVLFAGNFVCFLALCVTIVTGIVLLTDADRANDQVGIIVVSVAGALVCLQCAVIGCLILFGTMAAAARLPFIVMENT